MEPLYKEALGEVANFVGAQPDNIVIVMILIMIIMMMVMIMLTSLTY